MLDFTIVAFAIFMVIKALNKLKKAPALRASRRTDTNEGYCGRGSAIYSNVALNQLC